MHERGAVQELDRRRGAIGERRIVVAAGRRHRQAELRPNARTAGKHRGTNQPRRASAASLVRLAAGPAPRRAPSGFASWLARSCSSWSHRHRHRCKHGLLSSADVSSRIDTWPGIVNPRPASAAGDRHRCRHRRPRLRRRAGGAPGSTSPCSTAPPRPAASCAKSRSAASASTRGPTVFTMRWVFDELFAAIGARLDDHLRLRPAETLLARHAWSMASSGSTCSPTSSARSMRSPPSRGRGRPPLIAPSASALPADLPHARGTVPARLEADAGVARGARRLARPARADAHLAVRHAVGQPRRLLPGRRACASCSAAMRPTAARHRSAPATLMLVAHVEQAKASGWSKAACTAWRVRSQFARRTRRRLRSAYDAPVRGNHRPRRPRLRHASSPAARRVDASAVVFNGDAAALGSRPARCAGQRPPSQHRTSKPPIAVGADLERSSTRCQGFPLLRHNVFFGADYREEFEATCFAARRCRPPPRCTSAPRIATTADEARVHRADRRGGERLLCLVNAPARGDTAPLSADGDPAMRTQDELRCCCAAACR